MATLAIARAAAAKTAREHKQPMYVIKDTSRDTHPAVSYFAADADTLDTFYAGLEPVAAFDSSGHEE